MRLTGLVLHSCGFVFYESSVNTSISSLKVPINTKNEPHFVNTVITSIAIVFVITFIYQMCY